MLNLLRVLCLLTSLASVAVWVVWRQAPKYVRALDDEHVAAYEEEHEDRLDAAAEMLKTDREQGLVLLEALLEDLEHVRKLDRLDPIKRKVLGLFVRQYEATDRPEVALDYADRFHAFDERDLFNQARRNHLMLQDPSRREEAEELVPRLYRLVPDLPSVTSAYIALCLRRGEHVEAFRAALDSRRAVPLEWRAFWDEGGDFSHKAWAELILTPEGEDVYTTAYRLPGTPRIRIYLPSEYELRIDDWDVTFRTRESRSEHRGRDLAIEYHQLREEDGVIHADVQIDPFVVIAVPEELHEVDLMEVGLRMTIEPLMSSHLEHLRRNESVLADVRAWLEAEGREEDLVFIARWARD